MMIAARLSLAVLLSASSLAFAADDAERVTVADPYVRLMPPGARTTAAFMVLKNNGDQDARLVKAESAAAKTVELHTHLNEGGVMKMRQVPGIDIKAKGETALKPGGFHIMLIDPTAPLKDGDAVTLTLGFADGSNKKVDAIVKKPVSAQAAMDHSANGHKH